MSQNNRNSKAGLGGSDKNESFHLHTQAVLTEENGICLMKWGRWDTGEFHTVTKGEGSHLGSVKALYNNKSLYKPLYTTSKRSVGSLHKLSQHCFRVYNKSYLSSQIGKASQMMGRCSETFVQKTDTIYNTKFESRKIKAFVFLTNMVTQLYNFLFIVQYKY